MSIYNILCMGDNSYIMEIAKVKLYFFISLTEVKKQQSDYIILYYIIILLYIILYYIASDRMAHKNIIRTFPGLRAFNWHPSCQSWWTMGGEQLRQTQPLRKFLYWRETRCNRMVANYLFYRHVTITVRQFGVMKIWRLLIIQL